MILKKDHKIPLDKFIDYCLYDKKNGYYMNSNPFGTTGDFTTGPNISRLFSEMVAIWTISFWESLGSPKKFNLVELGAGNGEMMKVMIESFKKFPFFISKCTIFIYEKSPKLIKEQKKNIKFKNIKWIKSLKRLNKSPSIYLANEFFDALPIKQFSKSKNSWFEKFVHFYGNKKAKFINKKVDIRKIEKKINYKISKNQDFIEYSENGLKYLKEIFKIIKKNSGGLLLIDYGYNNKKMKNTLQGVSNHKFANILENIGNVDITQNISFDLFKRFTKELGELENNLTTQKDFLIKMGIKERAEIISRNKSFLKKTDIYYRLKRLIDEKQMGSLFKVMLIKNKKDKFKLGF